VFGTIQAIEEVSNIYVRPAGHINGRGGQLGVSGMLDVLAGSASMDGYRVRTSEHEFLVLIANHQSCCESWGYLCSEDNPQYFIGAELLAVRLTDKALNQKVVEATMYVGDDGGGVQFVDFQTDRGAFQIAVYNGHNGYYGHEVLIAKDEEILLREVL
jgi:hypothetical protein